MSTSPPKLPTTAEASDYAPYSLTAILALAVAGLYAVLLLALGFTAFFAGQPFLMAPLLALPAAALVLAFAARRQILSSEGTQAGLPIATAAWWIAVVGGLGYAAYLLAIGFAIRQDAAGRFNEWAKNVAEIDPAAPRDPALFRAFSTTVEPARQESLGPTNIDGILKERREELAWFRQCDLVRMAARNKGQTTFTADSLASWELDPTQALVCGLNARMRTPEGEFYMLLPMTRQQVNGVPKWQIKGGSNFVKAALLTRYGQLVQDVENSATLFVLADVLPVFNVHSLSPDAIIELTKPNAGGVARRTDLLALARGGAVGGYGWVAPASPASAGVLSGPMFACPDPARESAARTRFQSLLQTGRIGPSGMLSQIPVEQSPVFTHAGGRIEVKVPVELQVNNGEMPCRGYAVVVCDAPETLAKMDELKAAANTDPLERYTPAKNPPATWRLVRFESDLRPLPKPQGGGGGGGPGVPGMPNLGSAE